jgi:exodeoxyribonuclease-1
MTHTFLWHDYETFGRNPRRDRPAQFAAIRTDAELNIIGEPIELFCHPPQDMLPDPQACLLTGITPQLTQEKGVNEASFAHLIHQIFNQAGTCGVGYNTIRFDDEVTRFLFYRNLIDPYAREWQNECSRWDLLDVVRTMYALRPEGMVWPRREDGLPSFKLEHLTAANALVHAQAHDALSDVYATIALARKIRALQPRLFEFCFALRKKCQAHQEINLVQPQPVIHISGMYAAERGCLAIVLPLMAHPSNSNEVIVYDLACNPQGLSALSAEEIAHRLFTPQDILVKEGRDRLPFKSIHLNKSPVIVRNLKTLRAQDLTRWKIDLAHCQRHAIALLAQPELKDKLTEAYVSLAERRLDVDESLYAGFINNADRQTLNQIRQFSPEALKKTRFSFTDPKLTELVLRYRARNWPETLSPFEYEQWETLRAARLLEGIDGYVNIDDYLLQLDLLAEKGPLNLAQQAILDQLYAWAETLVSDNLIE